MLLTVIILATIMAVFAVIGYQSGTRASLFTAVVLLVGLLLIARAGGTVAKLINGLYFGVRFVLAGGVQALGAGGDRAAAITEVIQNMGPVSGLVDPNSPGPALVLVLIILVLITLWLGRVQRFRLRGPASLGGLLVGLFNGYLLGAFLLVSLMAEQAAFLPLPFGLNAQAQQAAPAAATTGGPSLFSQLLTDIQNASENTLALIIMAAIGIFIIVAAYLSTRGTGRSKRNGAG